MDEASVNSLSKLIISLFEESRERSFPFAGARKLLKQYPSNYQELIPDLDWFDSTIAGYASRADRIEDWTLSETEEAMALLSLPFYDKHPEYLPLQQDVAVQSDLYYDIEVHEKMRLALLQLLNRRKNLLISR